MKIDRLLFAGLSCLLAVGIALSSGTAWADTEGFIAGADISMLPVLEKAGVVFRDNEGSADGIQILRNHGCNLFRVRLFVNPDPDFNKSDGAIQDLAYVRTLAKRIKASGGIFLLDIHYSDTWADPGKQFKPKAWQGMAFDALEQEVHDYTASVLKDLQENGAMPDMVQVGNEITSGMVWPDGRVVYSPPEKVPASWEHFARLFNAGAKAVRSFQTDSHKIPIVLHIHGGGREGLAKWFLERFTKNAVDFDIVGLSFYPAWNDTLPNLKQNMADIAQTWGKDILIAETSYPWEPLDAGRKELMTWPQTPAGQKQFVQDLTAAIQAAPGHHGLGYVWWYPEAIPVPGLHIWRNGAEALFDGQGRALPALDAFNQR